MQILSGVLVCFVLLILLRGAWLLFMDAEERYKKEKDERLVASAAEVISELLHSWDYGELESLEAKVGSAASKWNAACTNTELAYASDHSYADYSKAVEAAAEALRDAVQALEAYEQDGED